MSINRIVKTSNGNIELYSGIVYISYVPAASYARAIASDTVGVFFQNELLCTISTADQITLEPLSGPEPPATFIANELAKRLGLDFFFLASQSGGPELLEAEFVAPAAGATFVTDYVLPLDIQAAYTFRTVAVYTLAGQNLSGWNESNVTAKVLGDGVTLPISSPNLPGASQNNVALPIPQNFVLPFIGINTLSYRVQPHGLNDLLFKVYFQIFKRVV